MFGAGHRTDRIAHGFCSQTPRPNYLGLLSNESPSAPHNSSIISYRCRSASSLPALTRYRLQHYSLQAPSRDLSSPITVVIIIVACPVTYAASLEALPIRESHLKQRIQPSRQPSPNAPPAPHCGQFSLSATATVCDRPASG